MELNYHNTRLIFAIILAFCISCEDNDSEDNNSDVNCDIYSGRGNLVSYDQIVEFNKEAFEIVIKNIYGFDPNVTYSLIALNTFIFLYQFGTEFSDPEAAGIFIYAFGLIPADFSIITMFTSMFLHGGIAHIIGNMWFLWIFGDNVESTLGHVKFALFYLLCGVAAALCQVLMNPGSEIPMVGASGAIAGVLGL
jgi:membrane associated rhomboid family serine protease